MWKKECRMYDHIDTIQSSKFTFFTLTDEIIQQYREDGEQYFMSREDK